jgi:hypothetical protein
MRSEPPVAVVVDERLTDEQLAALPLLLDAKPPSEVASAIGVAPAEVKAWRRDPVFAGVLSELVAQRRRLVLEALDAAVPEAMEMLRKIVKGHVFPEGCAPDKVMVTAAIAILDRGGLPKTERIEHALPTPKDPLSALPDEDLDREIAEAEAEARPRIVDIREAGEG